MILSQWMYANRVNNVDVCIGIQVYLYHSVASTGGGLWVATLKRDGLLWYFHWNSESISNYDWQILSL